MGMPTKQTRRQKGDGRRIVLRTALQNTSNRRRELALGFRLGAPRCSRVSPFSEDDRLTSFQQDASDFSAPQPHSAERVVGQRDAHGTPFGLGLLHVGQCGEGVIACVSFGVDSPCQFCASQWATSLFGTPAISIYKIAHVNS